MFRRHNCVTDPLTRQWWRDYQQVMKDGNPLGLSFTEYVAHRVVSLGTVFIYSATNTSQTPWYVSSCGHKHPWGESCGTMTAAQ